MRFQNRRAGDGGNSAGDAVLESFRRSCRRPLSEKPGKIEILPRAPENFKSSKDDFEPKCENVKQHTRLRKRIVYEPDIGLREQKDPFIDDTEKLIQKARRALEPLVEESTSLLKNDGSPCTMDILEAERLWDNVPIGLKSPVPISYMEENSPPNPRASMVNNFLEDCLQNGQQENTFSGGNHHGPVEALKLMLFNLQAVQHSFHKNKSDRPNEESPKVSSKDEDFKLGDCDMIPVARSLQRALHHLSRLKGLVDDTNDKEESTGSLKT
ncbi:lung adenoma susceptibility protein 2 [Crotalus adamanteus]|uniref:Lung adenoma susceptibility protein 2 n=1 Tax=Crotalus adamanteus TaxID=8729 RepID=A0AAW1C396_CROAD